MIKACLFDMDGLMFDTETAYSVVQEKMSAKRGKVFTVDVKTPLMGKRAHEVMLLLKAFWETNEGVEELLREQDEMLVELYNTSVEKLEGLDTLLAFLNKHGIRKCIGTSSRKFLVDVLLEKHGLQKEFEFVVSGDMVSRGKPDPEIYTLCLEKLGLDPSECLVLEDSRNGVKAGKAAGCMTCAIPSLFTRHEDFSISDIIASSLADGKLLEFIKPQ